MRTEHFEAVPGKTILKLVSTAGGDKKSRLSRRKRIFLRAPQFVDGGVTLNIEYEGP